MQEHILQYFVYEHLPPALAEVSRPFCELAKTIVATLPRNPERTVALRKLMEAKDCAVRALIAKEPAVEIGADQRDPLAVHRGHSDHPRSHGSQEDWKESAPEPQIELEPTPESRDR